MGAHTVPLAWGRRIWAHSPWHVAERRYQQAHSRRRGRRGNRALCMRERVREGVQGVPEIEVGETESRNGKRPRCVQCAQPAEAMNPVTL